MRLLSYSRNIGKVWTVIIFILFIIAYAVLNSPEIQLFMFRIYKTKTYKEKEYKKCLEGIKSCTRFYRGIVGGKPGRKNCRTKTQCKEIFENR